MRHCYYVADGRRNGPRPKAAIEHPSRVYRGEVDARHAAALASEKHRGQRMDVGSLDQLPAWATEIYTLGHEVLTPEAVPDDDHEVYAMRGRPATQAGSLPPNVGILHWTRVPPELAATFPQHPVSSQPFGQFVATRRLTGNELRDYGVELSN